MFASLLDRLRPSRLRPSRILNPFYSIDQGTGLALRLRKIIQVSQGLLETLLASFFSVTPSTATERVVSHYNRVKTDDT